MRHERLLGRTPMPPQTSVTTLRNARWPTIDACCIWSRKHIPADMKCMLVQENRMLHRWRRFSRTERMLIAASSQLSTKETNFQLNAACIFDGIAKQLLTATDKGLGWALLKVIAESMAFIDQ